MRLVEAMPGVEFREVEVAHLGGPDDASRRGLTLVDVKPPVGKKSAD